MADVNAVEWAMTVDYRSNDPAIGYNRRPRVDDVGSPHRLIAPHEADPGYQGGQMALSTIPSA